MRTVIVGGGFTGVLLARRLISEKNDVVLIDNDSEVAGQLSNRLDCTVVEADGNSLATLEEAGIAKARALVCLTGSDEVNMITCSLVDTIYPKLLKVARVRNYAYYSNSATTLARHKELFTRARARPVYGIDYMIHPDVEAAQAIVTAVEHGGVMEALQFGDSGYELVRMTCEAGSLLQGKRLSETRGLINKPFLVAYVESDSGSSLATGSTIVRKGDRVGILLNRDDVEDIANMCGAWVFDVKRILLVGAGRIGTLVAEKLATTKNIPLLSKLFKFGAGKRFMIIDSDSERAKAASEHFPAAQVSKGDITDESFIEEEGIKNFDIAISTTGNYELNMVISAYLESLGVKKSVALVSSTAFSHISRMLGIDVAVPIRDAVVDSILSHLRGSAIMGIHTVGTGDLQIIECMIGLSSKLQGQPLRNIDTKGEFLVLLTKHQETNKYEIARGNTVLERGDSVVIITYSKNNDKVIAKFAGDVKARA